jgi:hypothetical protein
MVDVDIHATCGHKSATTPSLPGTDFGIEQVLVIARVEHAGEQSLEEHLQYSGWPQQCSPQRTSLNGLN